MIDFENFLTGWPETLIGCAELCLESLTYATSTTRGEFVDVEEGTSAITNSNITNFIWRTSTEAVKTLEVIISKALALTKTAICNSIIQSAGNAFAGGLMHITHTGTLSQLHSSFTAVCSLCLRSDDPSTRCLPKTWLEVCGEYNF